MICLKRVIQFLSVLLIVCMAPSFTADAVSVTAECAVLLCADTGEVLFSQNGKMRHSMASTTKIMTALLTLETGEPERAVTVTKKMTAVEGTSMGLLPGDTVTLYGLACGMLLSSGNDAANTAAIALAGSQEMFAERMNDRAAQIGMTQTHFVTPSGLDDDLHYSTAYDMALLGCEAIRNPQFLRICSSKSLTVSYGNPPYHRVLSNHNRLLKLYAPCIGVKTGFTKKSGRCLVSAARRDGVTLVAVTLNAPDDWNDHMSLYEYGFSAVHCAPLESGQTVLTLPVAGGLQNTVQVGFVSAPCAVYDAQEGAVERTVYCKPFVYAPVEQGEIVGKAVYTQSGKVLCEADLVAHKDVAARPIVVPVPQEEKSLFQRALEKIKGVF